MYARSQEFFKGGSPGNIYLFSCKLVQYGGFWRMLLGVNFSFVVIGSVPAKKRLNIMLIIHIMMHVMHA